MIPALAWFAVAAALQEGPPLISPEVAVDGIVTFRIRAPKASKVAVSSWDLGPWLGGPAKELARDERGVWSVSIGPVDPGLYDYVFEIDGVRTVDMANGLVCAGRHRPRSAVEVPGPPDRPRRDEWRDVPHGAVTTHWYASGGARRRVHVYTPPGYAKDPERRYAALYLLHGSGDDDSHWTVLGRANVVADNLVADKRAEPMIIVMPDVEGNYEGCERDLLEVWIPLVESAYRVKPDRESRAIAGLSNGGGQSLWAGLRHLDRFGWVGAFSASTWEMASGVPGAQKDPDRLNAALRLLWIRVGSEDHLLGTTRGFIGMLKAKGIRHDYAETAGGHAWSVWRRDLAEFLPLLFRP